MEWNLSGRLFLATYDYQENYDASVAFGVFGARAGDASRLRKLRRGDLVLIRDNREKRRLQLFGAGVVVGDLFETTNSPYREHLWPDEATASKAIYTLRIPVDFKSAPQPSGPAKWSDLNDLKIMDDKCNDYLIGALQWGPKFKNNLVPYLNEAEALRRAFGIRAKNLGSPSTQQ